MGEGEGKRRVGGGILTSPSVLKQTGEGPFLGERLHLNFREKKEFWPVSDPDLDLNPGFESGSKTNSRLDPDQET